MIKTPNSKHTKALAALRRADPGSFEVVIEWLEEELAEQDGRNRYLTGDEAFKGLGRSLALDDVIKRIQLKPR